MAEQPSEQPATGFDSLYPDLGVSYTGGPSYRPIRSEETFGPDGRPMRAASYNQSVASPWHTQPAMGGGVGPEPRTPPPRFPPGSEAAVGASYGPDMSMEQNSGGLLPFDPERGRAIPSGMFASVGAERYNLPPLRRCH